MYKVRKKLIVLQYFHQLLCVLFAAICFFVAFPFLQSVEYKIILSSCLVANIIFCFLLAKLVIYNFYKKIKSHLDTMLLVNGESKNIIAKVENEFNYLIESSEKQIEYIKENLKNAKKISNMLVETTKTSDNSKILSENVTRMLNDGTATMQKMVEAVLTIEKAKDFLIDISGLIKKISKDTSTIHNIVTTTELLSLNASIEAARAGETGKGFSVIAEEVGNLAKNSGVEAKEIEKIVVNSQKQISEMIESNQNRVEIGKEASHLALDFFTKLKNEMDGIISRSENIRASTWEQKQGIDLVEVKSEEIITYVLKNLNEMSFYYSECKKYFSTFDDLDELVKMIREV